MKSFAFMCSKARSQAAVILRWSEKRVELSFLALLELFSILTGALNAGIEFLERLRLGVLFENTNESPARYRGVVKRRNHFAAARRIADEATSLKIVTRLVQPGHSPVRL